MDQKTKIVVGVIVAGILLAGYQIYDFRTEDVPRMEAQRQKLESEVVKKQAELKKLQNFAQNIETVKTELKELNLQLEAALEYMPRSLNLSGLLRKLTMLAQNSGVDLSTFKPKRQEEKKPGAFYSTISIDFDLKGTFTQTLVFLDQLSRLKRIVNVDFLRMKVEKDSGRSGGTVASTQASIRTYRFSE